MAAEEWTEALDVAKDLRFLCPCDTGLGKENNLEIKDYNVEIFASQKLLLVEFGAPLPVSSSVKTASSMYCIQQCLMCPCDTGLGKEIYNTEYNAENCVSKVS
jgi:hypothetical protein